LEQRRDQPHTARIRENSERLCEVLEHALVRETLQNEGHPLGLHALDLTAIEWDNRTKRRWRSLHSREDDTEMAAEAIACPHGIVRTLPVVDNGAVSNLYGTKRSTFELSTLG